MTAPPIPPQGPLLLGARRLGYDWLGPLSPGGPPPWSGSVLGGATDPAFAAKRVYARVESPTGALLAPWLDLPALPTLHSGPGGATTLTLTLPRPYGAGDEPGDVGGYGTLAWGNRVTIYVATPRLATRQVSASAVGTAIVGRAAVGRAGGGPGVAVWAGQIEDVTPIPPAAYEVAVVSADRTLDEAVVAGTYVAEADPLASAREVIDRYCQALRWDTRNDAFSGSPGGGTFVNQTVRSILDSLVAQAGPDYFYFVTPRRTVRLISADTAAPPTHTLVVGRDAVDVRLAKIGANRSKRIVVVWGQQGTDPSAGGYVEAQASDYAVTNDRALVVSDSSIPNAAIALTVGQFALQARDQIVLRAQLAVLDGSYDIEALAVGDTVRLLVESEPGALSPALLGTVPVGEGGIQDYAGRNLILSTLDYSLDRAVITLSQEVPVADRILLRIRQALAAHLAQH